MPKITNGFGHCSKLFGHINYQSYTYSDSLFFEAWTWFRKRFGPMIMFSIKITKRPTFLTVTVPDGLHERFWLFLSVQHRFQKL